MEQPLPPPSDMSPAEFRKHGHAVIDWIADYLDKPDKWPVLPDVRPGDIRGVLPQPTTAWRVLDAIRPTSKR